MSGPRRPRRARENDEARGSLAGRAADEPTDDELIDAVAKAVNVDADAVRLETTHASRVVIAGGKAFKFKRRVNLGFLDFRTLESRRSAGEDEVRLNRRLAPEVYLGLAPVTRGAGGRLHLGEIERDPGAHADVSSTDGPGAIDDWVVVMRELPAERMLNVLLEREALTEADEVDLDRLIDALAEFHARAPRGLDVAAMRTPDRVRAALETNLNGLVRSDVLAALDGPALTASTTAASPLRVGAAGSSTRPHAAAIAAFVTERARAMFDEAMPILERRRAEGRVVEGHGDLHARNVCMIPGAPVAYDCIEFSKALRCRDVSGEIAFLAMDLDAHDRPDLAERVVSRYAERTGDASFVEPQRFLRLSDAIVRALVESLRAIRPRDGGHVRKTDAARTSSARREALRYVTLAAGYALAPSVILMCGLPGSGKSTVARTVARPLRAEIVRSDEVRKELAGLAPTERGDAALYTAEMTERVYAGIIERAGRALAAGRHVVLDAAFPTRALRSRAIEALAARVPRGSWIVVECVASPEELERRLRRRTHDPREVSDADERVMREMAARFEPPEEVPPEHRRRVDSSDPNAALAVVAQLVATRAGAEAGRGA